MREDFSNWEDEESADNDDSPLKLAVPETEWKGSVRDLLPKGEVSKLLNVIKFIRELSS